MDTLTGNGGANTFVFADGDTGAVSGARDLITDFVPGTDHIDLTGIDADTTASGHDAFRFLGTAGFDGSAGALHTSYDAAHNVTILEGDTNGDGVADFGIELAGNVTLSQSDFTAGSLLLPVTATASAAGQTLTGGPLADTLSDGGYSGVTLVGGKGDDSYIVSDASTVVTETGGSPYVPPAGFTILGTADLNGDGELDVLLRNPTTNATELQLIKNGVGQTPVALPTWATWPAQGFVDANGDGHVDVLYQSPSDGRQYAVFLNGTTEISESLVSGQTVNAIQALTPVNAGTDTVQASIDYVLPTGVENLTLTGTANLNGTGNALDNVITGNSGDNILTGGAGSDTFVFNFGFGHDTVADFNVMQDILQVDHTMFADVAALLAHTADNAQGDAVITVDANDTITLHNVSTATLQQHQSDFHIV